MPQNLITVKISDSANLAQWRARLADDFALVYAYADTIADPADPQQRIPNPETKAQFAQRKIAEHVRDVHKQAKVLRELETSRSQILAAADTENNEVLTT